VVKKELKNLIEKAIFKAQENQKLPIFEIPEINLEYPKEKMHGDFASNIALSLSKKCRKKPIEVAEIIIDNFPQNKIIRQAKTALPGFINFVLSDELLQAQVEEILKQKDKFGLSKIGKNKKIHIDFVSANPTGPVTVGNARGGPFGDILANILKRNGYGVIREYYVNDAGKQIDSLGHSVLKDKKSEYNGKYIDELAKKIKEKDYRRVGEEAAQVILKDMIKPSMEALGIKFNSWFSEKKLQSGGEVDKTIKLLQKKGFVYKKDGAVWFKSISFGDDKDRVVIKADGQKTYFGSDIAYHLDKIKRGCIKLIDVWGADHHGDVARVKGALEALGYKDKLDVILTQLVKVIKDGKEIKMSKRVGTYISIDDLISEVGRDPIRFIFAMYSTNTHINFDINLAKEKSEKNPVYYVQYAYARIHGILDKIPSNKIQSPKLHLLKHPTELALIKELIKLPDLIKDIAGDYQVQKLPYFAIDLASAFHQFYNTCRVISRDKDLSAARQSLIKATQIVLKNTLDLIGVSAPKKM